MTAKAPRVREASPRVAAVAPHRLPGEAAARPEPAAVPVAGDAVKQAVKQRRRGRRKIEEKKG